MFRLADQQLVLSATDLASYLACGHLIEQKRAVALGERAKWRKPADPHGELAKTRGDAHERAQLHRLSADRGGHVDLSPAQTRYTREWLTEQAGRTLAEMRAGAPLIFQGLLFDGRWQGRVDFLRRVEIPSALGAHSYEVLDSKLARQVKPAVVHQLALYTRLLSEVQDFHPPAAFVVLGDGSEHPVELERYGALHRHVARRLERLLAVGPAATYPEPTAHCGICDLDLECSRRRRADDHLSLVAGARRDQRGRLADLGVTRVHELAAAPADLPVGKLGAERFELLRHQARLQVATWADGGRHHRHLAPAFDRGYARLPEPDAGDVFFDLEGDPYIGTDGDIEYLWGWCTADGAYGCTWAHDADEEKAALEAFVDLVVARRRMHPDLHVFHYAAHEASKLRSLALKYATREDEVDQLLREGVLVDLYAVVRQGMQVGEESYGLKRLERHTGFVRGETTVREGGGSIVAYEHWLETREPELLEAIRAYNADDCRSTLVLRDWLLDPMKAEAAAKLPCDFDALVAPEPKEYEPTARDARLAGIADRLAAGLSADGGDDDVHEAERRLLSHLMLFHKREAKPEWWRFFELCDLAPEQLIDERDAIGGLVPDPRFPPVVATKQSTDWSFTFPPQEFKLDGVECVDPATGKGLNVQLVEDDRVVLRKRTKDGPPTARAVIGGGALRTGALRDALAALGETVLGGEAAGAAARSILQREAPRLASGRPFAQDGDPEIGELIADTLDLQDSHLVVQGPPGTGKTYRGARMIVAAIEAGRRVAVTAPSHAAVQNLLTAVEDAADEAGLGFSGVYKGGGYDSPHGLVASVDDNPGTIGDFDLVAGTAWLLAREEHHGQFGLLFIDEAGQFSLANAAAVALCASSAVLLGDPQQLPQVTQASHPGTSGKSVLAHLLGGRNTVASDRGYLLTESWRMHPAVCEFVSERSYDRLLRSRDACARRGVTAAGGALSGAGLRVLAVAHEGRSQSSVEEAQAIAAACRDLLAGGTVTDDHGEARALLASDLMVVAPYNLAVRCIREHVPEGVAVGTVDRFQGQEAPVVFFAMTCSSAEDVPRGLDFLFDRNRMNVAVSRAQCLAVLVHSPRLLDADCRTLEAMELVNGACRFVEMASLPGRSTAGAVESLGRGA
jgi:predicted RecB family nuclease